MTEQETYNEIKSKLSNRAWRLNNLYWIVDERGQKIKFRLNYFQKWLLENLWYFNVILKARQLGMSTFIVIFITDACLFYANKTGGIIDITLDDATSKLDKARFAYNNLPDYIRQGIKLDKDNTQELSFSNGSKLTADTTFRGGTLQYLHISEYAKICKLEPIKAKEIKTGALNAVAVGQMVFIESTAEDGEGNFYEICKRAEDMSKMSIKLSALDFKFFFFPWWKNQSYSLAAPVDFVSSSKSIDYFNQLVLKKVLLTRDQKYWYTKKYELLGEDIKKEYPSSSEEAFEASTEDKYYKKQMLELKYAKRITEFAYEPALDVNVIWDLGIDDSAALTFVQISGKEIRVIDYIEESGEKIEFYISLLKEKGYRYGVMVLPHDANNRSLQTGTTTYEIVTSYGFKCVVVQRTDIEIGINLVRNILPNMWFIESKTGDIVEHLEQYAKKWSEQLGRYTGPKHDHHSHGADTIRYLAMWYKDISKESSTKKKFAIIRNKYRPAGGS